MGQIEPHEPDWGGRTVDPNRADGPAEPTRLGSYLRRLREGYGYTLRKVEERASAMGEAIDNSQLSRFEKGKAIPSFDKLRALARVFNVPVQNFSDVLDLEEYQHLRPETTDHATLLKAGAELVDRGEYGRAFVTYEKAIEVAETGSASPESKEMIAEARWRMAIALKKLGKLYMTERELREILKCREELSPRTRRRALLQLSFLYRELGDLYLAQVLARESLQLAREEGDRSAQAGVLNSLGNIEFDEDRYAEAEKCYREALAVLDEMGGYHQMRAMVLTNIGGCLAAQGHFEDGVSTLREAHCRAKEGGFRRVAALSLTRMAEAVRDHGDFSQSRDMLAESDALASRAEDVYHDILFLNAYHRWDMARNEGHGTREKIAFGRLRHLRSLLQRRFPEVDAFDRHIERTRR
ncbi:MAG: tetratricopeptide repeat protein [Acidobacteria bacterium]|nr:tetratricopeptide repeat protein [Acidobacteriota bacterium]NIM62059.1 tetratricopeptide repeat protein [Acidobacteriota bacterium]NIO59708.1 tetratricopeptide repeat protein [Acidobacteriota bacterium]NIQ30797.1 tetratricopeptide repeat protein [Acidobacteriota bacterium]NIQ85859.1 tetratricopeptide repeat protein [Acidobacteriota bacterium]